MSDKSTPNNAENPASNPAPIGEIEHGPSKLELFFEKNLKLLLLGLLLIIVAVAAFVITRQLGTAQAQEAGSALVSAEDPAALRKVTADYPDSAAAVSAQVLLAEQLWNEGKEEEAIKAYKSVISSGGDHPAVSNARFSLATAQHSRGQIEEARKLFEKIVANSEASYLHPFSLIALGDIAKAAGNEEKAESFYNRKIEDYGVYGDQGLALSRLGLLGVDAPEKVSPPPAEETATPQQPDLQIPDSLTPPEPTLTDEMEGNLDSAPKTAEEEAPTSPDDTTPETSQQEEAPTQEQEETIEDEDTSENTPLPPGDSPEPAAEEENSTKTPVEDASEESMEE
jgi:predicted negative regulator of RcsB-dependent stress response